MNKATLTIMLNRIFYPTFLLLSCLFTAENLYSRKHWNREDYMMAYYNDIYNAIEMRFQFYDPKFGPSNEDAYLEYCYFYASIDCKEWFLLMKARTNEQSVYNWSYLYVTDRNTTADLQFKFTVNPLHGTFWNVNNNNQRLVVINYENIKETKEYPFVPETYCVIKWDLLENFKNIRYISVTGKWHINGVWRSELFVNQVYDTYNPFGLPLKNNNPSSSSSMIVDHPIEYGNNPPDDNNEDNSNSVKVLPDIDGVMIAGAEVGEKVTVYSTSGLQIKSTVINDDIVKINLPQSQVYIVHVGQKRHKVAL